jgi:hypothetical protein
VLRWLYSSSPSLGSGDEVTTGAVRLPDGDLLIPLLLPDPEDGFALEEIGPEHPDYGMWMAVSEPGKDPRTATQET